METKMKFLRVLASALVSMFVLVGSIFFLPLSLPSNTTIVSAALLTPTPTPLPTSTPPIAQPPQANLDLKVDLKNELYFSGGGVPPLLCDIAPQELAQLPKVSVIYEFSTDGGKTLCIVGVPAQNGDQLTATLFDAAGFPIASGSFVIEKLQPTVGKVLTNDAARRHVGYMSKVTSSFGNNNSPMTDRIEIPFRTLPNLPENGYWVVDWQGQHIKSAVLQLLPPEPVVVIQPQTDSLFGETPCGTQAPGQVVPLLGMGFPPNTIVPFGLYRVLSDTTFTLVQSQFLQSNGTGVVDANIQIPPTAPRGRYFLLGVLHPESENEMYAGASSCRWTIEPSLATQPPQAVERYYQVRTMSDRSLDDSELQTILLGEALEQQQTVLQTLRDTNCYWIFSNQQIQFDEWTVFSVNLIEMYVTVREDADLYCNGERDRGSYTTETLYRVGFNIERFSDQWFVTKRWRVR